MKVLVVDDDDDIRETLVDIFTDEGLEVEAAANGAEALKRLRQSGPPCVVILDLMMPVMTGIELYAAMQMDPALAQVPVIISTSDPSIAPVGLVVVRKPVDLIRMIDLVKKLCPC